KAKRYLVTLDELDDVDRPGGLERELVEIFLVDQDELILSDLVALEHLVERDHVVIRRTMPLLFDRELAMGAQLSEGHSAVRLGGEVHADRDRHHPEADRAPPHGPGHSTDLLFAELPGLYGGTPKRCSDGRLQPLRVERPQRFVLEVGVDVTATRKEAGNPPHPGGAPLWRVGGATQPQVDEGTAPDRPGLFLPIAVDERRP